MKVSPADAQVISERVRVCVVPACVVPAFGADAIPADPARA